MKKGMAALAALVLVAILGLAGSARAATEEENRKVFEEGRRAASAGPLDVPLAGEAVLKLPAGMLFMPQPHATRVLNAMGNPGQDPRLQGLVFPAESARWFVTVRYENSGHIKDDDARDWNADDLLKSYREGTEEANKERQRMNVPALEILGWAEKPAYDASTHRLVWAMSSREKGAPENEPQGVNYNTYALGREGYFTLNLVTALADLPAHKPASHALLSALNFNEGRRYSDFNASTDHLAEYGLGALVVGVAAKKLGLLAAAGLFLAKFAKVGLVGLALVGGAVARFFKRGKRETPSA
jgi:uncharacterized membrane-anchored protein